MHSINVFSMALDYHRIDKDEPFNTYYGNFMMFFTYFYYCECVLKLTGLGPANYFGDGWCRFDFFLVVTGFLDQFFAELLRAYLPIPPMVLRCATFAPPTSLRRLVSCDPVRARHSCRVHESDPPTRARAAECSGSSACCVFCGC